MVCKRFSFGLSGWSGLVWLVWSGWFGWLYSRLGEELLLVLFCLFDRSFRAVCCIQYTVLVLSCLCAFDVNLRWETLSYLLAVLIDNN